MLEINCPLLEELVVDQFAFLKLNKFFQHIAGTCTKLRSILFKLQQHPREELTLSDIPTMSSVEYMELQLNTLIDDRLLSPLISGCVCSSYMHNHFLALPNVKKLLVRAIVYGPTAVTSVIHIPAIELPNLQQLGIPIKKFF
jgi:hypothetical protein